MTWKASSNPRAILFLSPTKRPSCKHVEEWFQITRRKDSPLAPLKRFWPSRTRVWHSLFYFSTYWGSPLSLVQKGREGRLEVYYRRPLTGANLLLGSSSGRMSIYTRDIPSDGWQHDREVPSRTWINFFWKLFKFFLFKLEWNFKNKEFKWPLSKEKTSGQMNCFCLAAEQLRGNFELSSFLNIVMFMRNNKKCMKQNGKSSWVVEDPGVNSSHVIRRCTSVLYRKVVNSTKTKKKDGLYCAIYELNLHNSPLI